MHTMVHQIFLLKLLEVPQTKLNLKQKEINSQISKIKICLLVQR